MKILLRENIFNKSFVTQLCKTKKNFERPRSKIHQLFSRSNTVHTVACVATLHFIVLTYLF